MLSKPVKPEWLFNDCIYVCFHVTGNVYTLYKLLFVCNSLINNRFGVSKAAHEFILLWAY